MKVLKFLGLGLLAVGATGGLAFAARLLRRSSTCPDCEGTLEIDSFDVEGEREEELTACVVATCPQCGVTFVSENGSPWFPASSRAGDMPPSPTIH